MICNRKLFVILLLISAVFSFAGCDLINPDEDPPSYIEVNSFSYAHTPTQVTDCPPGASNIKDVWVFVDKQFQGAYELPARFPVLKTGDTEVILRPGIFLNGISATRSPYPFYRSHISQLNLPENGTTTIEPSTSYLDSVSCSYFEDFEDQGFSLTSTNQSDTVMYQTTLGDPNNFEGQCGVVYLDSSHFVFEVTTTSAYDLPGGGAAVYVELDYRINQQMVLGLIVITPNMNDEKIPIYTFSPTDDWNKIYIQLGYTVSRYPNASGFKVFLGAFKEAQVANPVFYIDNLKVVHF